MRMRVRAAILARCGHVHYLLLLTPTWQVITSVRGGTDDDASGRRVCRRDGLSVPLVIHHKPRASISRLVCTNLCKDEVASAMVNLTQGQVRRFGVRVQGSHSRRAWPSLNALAVCLVRDCARSREGKRDGARCREIVGRRRIAHAARCPDRCA